MARNYDLYLNIFRERNQFYLSLNPTIMKIVNSDILLVCIKNLITIKKTRKLKLLSIDAVARKQSYYFAKRQMATNRD